jgi:hypothetical protein
MNEETVFDIQVHNLAICCHLQVLPKNIIMEQTVVPAGVTPLECHNNIEQSDVITATLTG